jgi:ribonuclease BN (tRNA processing enzyme)
MKIDILGCSGSVMKGYNTTSILVNGDTLIDAGSVASTLPEGAIRAIRNILITHTHMDHIKELPFVLDTLFSQKHEAITIWGSQTTIDTLNRHIFNGLIWPGIKEYNVNGDFITLREVPQGEFTIGKLRIKSLPVDHIPGSVQYLLSEGKGYVLFSGDTNSYPGLFDLVESLGEDLKAFFVEVSFPNRMDRIAEVSYHLTPMLLGKAIGGRISPSTRVIAYHIKPKYIDEIVAELPPNVAYITGGEGFEF